jgi:hypothetical protein
MKRSLSEAQTQMKIKLSTSAGRANAAATAKSTAAARARLEVRRELKAAKVLKRRKQTAHKLYVIRKRSGKQHNEAMKEEWRATEQTWRTLRDTIKEAEASLRRAVSGTRVEQEHALAEALARGYHLGLEHAEKLKQEKGHTR